MRVYVIRHGESELNLQKRWSGHFNTPLTEKGRKDAEKAGRFLEGISFDKIYTSDLCRAMETAEIAVGDCKYEISPLLREIDVGDLTAMPQKDYPPEVFTETRSVGYGRYHGESREDFYKRISSFMKDLEETSFETVALFCHGGVLRGMLDTVLETKLNRKHVCCDNCAIAIFDYKKENWSLYSWINLP